MALWNRLKDGIDTVERVASDALDEGKTRLEAHRARQTADKAAEALGYAVFRAWEQGHVLEATLVDRLARALQDHEREARRHEQAAASAAEWRQRREATGSTAPPSSAAATDPAPPHAGPADADRDPLAP